MVMDVVRDTAGDAAAAKPMPALDFFKHIFKVSLSDLPDKEYVIDEALLREYYSQSSDMTEKCDERDGYPPFIAIMDALREQLGDTDFLMTLKSLLHGELLDSDYSGNAPDVLFDGIADPPADKSKGSKKSRSKSQSSATLRIRHSYRWLLLAIELKNRRVRGGRTWTKGTLRFTIPIPEVLPASPLVI